MPTLQPMTGHKVHPGADNSSLISREALQAPRGQAHALSSVLRSYRSLKGLGLLLTSILFIGFGFLALDLTYPESELSADFGTQTVQASASM